MKNTFLFLLALCSFFCFDLMGQSQVDPEFIKLEHLRFDTETEEGLFEAYANQKIDFLGLFLAPRGKVSTQRREMIEKRLLKDLAALKSKKITSKSPAKQVKMVYSYVHENLLGKYKENSLMYQVFDDGTYNCVSSTAIIGWFFQQLEIPFSIRERPSHVYLIAYPKSDNIPVEPTAPELGYFKFNLRFKRFYVDFLHNTGVISDREMEEVDFEYLFAKYYFADTDIDLRQLAGIQYANDAIYNLEQDRYKRALQQFEKSYFLNPDQRTLLSIMSCTMELLDKIDWSKQEDRELFVRAERQMEYGVNGEYLQFLYAKAVEEETSKVGESPGLDTLHHYLIGQITDTTLIRRCNFIYNVGKANQMTVQSRYKKAHRYAEAALSYEPYDLDAQSLYIVTLANLMPFNDDFEALGNHLDSVATAFPGLAANTRFVGLQMLLELGKMEFFFESRKLKDAEKSRTAFETGMEGLPPDITIPSELIGDAYGAAVAYYFRIGNMGAARKACAQGLKYAPNNYQLKRRQQALR